MSLSALGLSGGAAGLAIGSGATTAGSWLGSVGSWLGSNWQPLLSSGTSILGSLLGMSSSSEMAHEQRKTMREYMKRQAEENSIARQWSENMSNTAHQREVADLKAAGLNPVLSATGGNGAVTPSTSSNILGASDASAGIAHEGRMRAIETIVGLADKLSQLNLNSALAKKASAEASSALSNVALNGAKISSEEAKADYDRARTGQEQVKSNVYTWLENAASSIGINFGGEPSGKSTSPSLVRNSAASSGSSIPSLVTNRGLVQDIKDAYKGFFKENPTEYPATRSVSDMRTKDAWFVVPRTLDNLNDPVTSKIVGRSVFWDPNKNDWYVPRPVGAQVSRDDFKTFYAKDQRGHFRHFRSNKTVIPKKGYKR